MKTQISTHNDRIDASLTKKAATSRGATARHFNTIVTFALFTLLFASICTAQQASITAVPNLIRYSGTLKDAQGVGSAPSSTVGVTFAIYTQQDGGAAVWQETQNVTPDASGQYSVILGSTTAAGLPDDLFSQQEQRWLAVQVQGQAEEARVLLVSVPYAFKAHEAETLGGLPASAFVRAPQSAVSGSVGTDADTTANAVGATGDASSSTTAQKNTPMGLPPAQITDFIPVYDAGAYINSVMSQDSVTTPTVVNDSVNFNLASSANSYEIGGTPVLRANSGSVQSLAVGGGTCSVNNGSSANTCVGEDAGTNIAATGIVNTYIGFAAGANNSSGGGNVGAGVGALNAVGSGYHNTAVGTYSGFYTTGSSNTFYGYGAGGDDVTGSSNVYIGSAGNASNPAESNTIRIGVQGTGLSQQSSAYMAGIVNNTVSNPANVYISPSGQLEVGASSSGVTGNCSSGTSGYFAQWTGTGTTIGCPDTNLTLLSTTGLHMAGSITATATVTASTVNATGGFQANGAPGITWTANLTDANGNACYMSFREGILVDSTC